MFSITLVNIDSYQASPIPEFDVTFSEFRGSEIKKVPVIRIFGSTATGKHNEYDLVIYSMLKIV
jgi:DNA polymerase zeta